MMEKSGIISDVFNFGSLINASFSSIFIIAYPEKDFKFNRYAEAEGK